MPFLALTFMSSTVAADFYGIHYTTAVMQAIPKPMYWPCFVIATAGALIGSQSLITSTFSIVRQAMRLNCFPPVKILHTGNTSNYRCASSQHSSHLNVLIPCSVWSVCQLLSPPSHPPPPPTPLKILHTGDRLNVVLHLHAVIPCSVQSVSQLAPPSPLGCQHLAHR